MKLVDSNKQNEFSEFKREKGWLKGQKGRKK